MKQLNALYKCKLCGIMTARTRPTCIGCEAGLPSDERRTPVELKKQSTKQIKSKLPGGR